MKSALTFFIYLVFVLFLCPLSAQKKYIVRDIKSFGAKGDGRTNDHLSFQRAAEYFNKRGGNGKLIISKGIYIIGRQTFTGGKPDKPAYEGENVLHFTNIKNFKIEGRSSATLKYRDSLRFGAFTPDAGLPYEHGNNLFLNHSYAAVIGWCISFSNCSNISIYNLTIDGNNKGIILGGVWGDVGRQMPHSGVFIQNSKNVIVNKINAHHFGLDGIYVSNKESGITDSISILNSSFEYNARQGLSWVGGNHLFVKNCKFNNTGKEAFSSPPSAGVDIEAEVGPIQNGRFSNCEFINNTGLGVVADAGNSRNCTFANCTIWGATNWSVWVTKPGFTFKDCNIYGSIVHGYNSPDEKNSTKYINCTFEDKAYRGKEPYGNYIIESNNAKRVSFTGCTFIANKKRLCWISIDAKSRPEEKYQFTNCSFVINNIADSKENMTGLLGGMTLKNCTFNFKNPLDKAKSYLINYKEGVNVDLGGNKIIYSVKKYN